MMRRPRMHGFGGGMRIGRHFGRHMHMPPPVMPPFMHRPYLPRFGCCGCGGCMMSVLGAGVFVLLMMLSYIFY